MTNLKVFTLCVTAVVCVGGCASDKEFLQAQMDLHKQSQADQKPLVEITAQPGQQITGLQSLRVYTPAPAPQLRQSQNEWAGVVSQAIGITGTVLGIRYAGQAAIGLSNSIGSSNAQISSQIQAPGTVTTTTNTLSGTGTLGSGAFSPSDATHTPTVVVQPAPLVVTQPTPTVVNPVVVNPVVVNPVIVP